MATKSTTKKLEDTHIATFEAYIPTIKSALLFGSDGCQVKLEISGTDMEAALALARDGQNKILRISVFDGSDEVAKAIRETS